MQCCDVYKSHLRTLCKQNCELTVAAEIYGHVVISSYSQFFSLREGPGSFDHSLNLQSAKLI